VLCNPTWENHRGIFESAGFEVIDYTYFDGKTRGVDFAGMVKSLESFPKNTTVLLHACCHNPTGADITEAQWLQVIDICKNKSLIPFLDMAYQGFATIVLSCMATSWPCACTERMPNSGFL
jgi:aromatic-amino-acid transaminase